MSLSSPHHTEPRWQEMMEDPIIVLLMQRDGVAQEALLPMLQETSEYLSHRWRQGAF